jgi:hypothetical protein
LFVSGVFIEDRRSRILDERVFALHVIPREPERALRARAGPSARFTRWSLAAFGVFFALRARVWPEHG